MFCREGLAGGWDGGGDCMAEEGVMKSSKSSKSLEVVGLISSWLNSGR